MNRGHMKYYLSFVSIVIAGALVTELITTAKAEDDEQGNQSIIELDSGIQAEISKVILTLSSTQKTESEVAEIMNDFVALESISPANKLLQVLAIYGGKEEHRIDPHMEMTKRALLANILNKMSQKEVVEAVVPRFELAKDVRMKQSMRHVLDEVAFRGGSVDPDFSAFTAFIEKQKQDPPQDLVVYMYMLMPEMALREMRKVYSCVRVEGEDLPHAEIETFKAIVEMGNWWESLYVAEMVRRNPRLRDPELIRQLKEDPSEIVRSVSVNID